MKDLNEIIHEKNIKLKRIYEIRWLSMGDAVSAIIRNYEALLLLTSEAALGEPTGIGLNKQLSSYANLALIHLACEVLAVTNHLSKVFQNREVCFFTVRGNLNDCIETLEDLRNNNGPVMTAMEAEINAAPRGQCKGPLKYLVAKLHHCYPGAISLPVSQNFFARFFRCRPVADSSRCLTFSLRCNKHKKTLFAYIFID